MRLRVDPSFDAVMARDPANQAADEQVRRRFGGSESVIVVLNTADAYALGSLRRLDALTRALYELPGVQAVQSLTTVSLPDPGNGELRIQPLQPADYENPLTSARLRSIVTGNPLLRNHLVSADGRSAAVVVTLASGAEREMLEQHIAQRIYETADAYRSAGEVWVSGPPLVRAETGRVVLAQLQWMIPGIAIVLVAVLALAFRTLASVLLPLATIGITLACTGAALALLDRPLNLVTALVPPLLVTMALAYCAHVLSEHETLRAAEPDARRRIRRLFPEVAAPIVLTGITTSVGLLAIAQTDLPALREFAVLSAFGVLLTVMLCLSFVPAALCFGRPGVRIRPGRSWTARIADQLGSFNIRHRRAITAAAAAAFVVALMLATQIQVGDEFVGTFSPQTRVRTDFEAVNRYFGGANPVSIAIDGQRADTFTSLQNLRHIDRLKDWLATQPEVGVVTALTDHLRVLSTTFAPESAAPDGLPESGELVRQLLFFGNSDALKGVVNGDLSATQLQVRLRVDDTISVSAFVERLESRLAALPEPWSTHVSGDSIRLAQSVRSVTADQIQSIALALILIYLVLALQFASLKIGLLATLPTLLQTALYFGALGAGGVHLNVTTSLVECLVLGLAVDDTIHYLTRFNRAARQRCSETEGARLALSAVLRPVTMTKGILALGFLMLMTSELSSHVTFGWLAAAALGMSWLVDVLVTPAFMSGVRVVTLWDSLRLNLGQDVQLTIPLFHGLSTRQARVFALMAELQELPAGTRLMTEGEAAGSGVRGPSGDIYVVIDGALSVFIERDGRRVELRRLRRGDVVGEAGYFGQRRTASVDSLTPVRVLRFDDADQERICKRYPAVAARVFLNLNRIQAERRAQARDVTASQALAPAAPPRPAPVDILRP